MAKRSSTRGAGGSLKKKADGRVSRDVTPSRGATRDVATEVDAIVSSLRRLGSKRVRDDMADRYGIRLPDPDMAFGVGMGAIQKVAKAHVRKGAAGAAWNHALAAGLWETGWYEARSAAAFIDDPALVTAAQMEAWCRDFDNWGIVDTVCFKLFDRVATDVAFKKIEQWSKAKGEFQKRAAFALLASIALHDKELDDEVFRRRLPLAEHAATDDRNFVKKGVSWALRGVARRSSGLREEVRELAERLVASLDQSSRWIGKDVLRQIK